MNLRLQKISREEYLNNDNLILLEEEYSRAFGLIACESIQYKLSWQSSEVDPELSNLGHSKYGVGIDQCYSIFSCETQEIFVKLKLDGVYYQSIVRKQKLYVFSELEVVVVNLEGMEINTTPLNDTFKEFAIRADTLVVTTSDDSEIIFEL